MMYLAADDDAGPDLRLRLEGRRADEPGLVLQPAWPTGTATVEFGTETDDVTVTELTGD